MKTASGYFWTIDDPRHRLQHKIYLRLLSTDQGLAGAHAVSIDTEG